MCDGKTAHQFLFPVRFPERPPAGSGHDNRWTALPVPPSSPAQSRSAGQRPSAPPYFRRRYGARRDLPARAATPDGSSRGVDTTMLYVQLLPRTCGVNMPDAIENRRGLSPADPMDPAQSQPRPDLRISHPEPRRDSPTRHAEGLPGCGAPFSPLSPSRFPATPPFGATPPRSASAGLVSLPRCEQDPPLCNQTRRRHLIHDPPSAGGSGRPRPPRPAGLIRSEGPPAAGSMAAQTASLEDDQRLQQELRRTDNLLSNPPAAHPLHRYPHWRMHPPASRTAHAGWGRTMGAPRPPRQSCTPNASFPSIPRFGAPRNAFWPCALWPGRNFWPDRKASCSLMVARGARITGLFETLA